MCSLQSYLRNGRLDIQESTQSVPVTIVPTVPISCPPCSITVNIANPVGLTVSQCSMTFSASDAPMTDHTINIRAVPTAGTNSRVARLQFRPVESFISGSAWDNHTITSIPVSTAVFLCMGQSHHHVHSCKYSCLSRFCLSVLCQVFDFDSKS